MIKKSRKPLVPNCRQCNGQCCRYFALQINPPGSMKEVDNIRWFLAHRKISVFKDGKDWFVQIWNPCRYLTKGSKCSIYGKRPLICREYGRDIRHEPCLDSPEAHDLYFPTIEAFEAYALKKGKRRKKL